MHFGKELVSFRNKMNWNQKQMSAQLNISRTMLIEWEQGIKFPSEQQQQGLLDWMSKRLEKQITIKPTPEGKQDIDIIQEEKMIDIGVESEITILQTKRIQLEKQIEMDYELQESYKLMTDFPPECFVSYKNMLVNSKNILCHRISHIRKKQGLSQKEVADAIGCLLKTYQNYENGRSRYGINWINVIKTILTIPEVLLDINVITRQQSRFIKLWRIHLSYVRLQFISPCKSFADFKKRNLNCNVDIKTEQKEHYLYVNYLYFPEMIIESDIIESMLHSLHSCLECDTKIIVVQLPNNKAIKRFFKSNGYRECLKKSTSFISKGQFYRDLNG
ncbi:helix-turn-helix domain-containing protein [Brevibacillus sp. NPDC058079]|uniref:helix-turn-helix domain-containing protein n=1 Tax=Brevibacillus sp. NPDC058079 TaxID=3346330 RepID=UPI0036E2D60C